MTAQNRNISPWRRMILRKAVTWVFYLVQLPMFWANMRNSRVSKLETKKGIHSEVIYRMVIIVNNIVLHV